VGNLDGAACVVVSILETVTGEVYRLYTTSLDRTARKIGKGNRAEKLEAIP
jgi:hypothetical protein